jgi:hypothetical protein
MTSTFFSMPDTSKNQPGHNDAELSGLGLALRKAAQPQPGELVIVQCQVFRCLGYYDSEGKWRNVRTGQELADVKGWWRIGDDTFTPIY